MSYIYKASDFEGLSFNEMLDKVIIDSLESLKKCYYVDSKGNFSYRGFAEQDFLPFVFEDISKGESFLYSNQLAGLIYYSFFLKEFLKYKKDVK